MSHLTQEQRYTIEVLNNQNYSQTAIAKIIGKHKSVVCRELNRNCDKRNGAYRADLAHRRCKKRHSDKNKIIYLTDEVKSFINHFIEKRRYSPEQIVGIAREYGISCVSHERIYQYIWSDKKKGGGLFLNLRHKGKSYRKRGASKDKRGQIVNRKGIEERPPEVALKQRLGDLEIDLIVSSNGNLLTINDRFSNLCKIRKVNTKEAPEIQEVLTQALMEWKPILKTITSDNGKEFARHEKIAEILGISYFFANPYCSWERGANENMNGLIRQYFPKKMSFKNLTKEDIQYVEDQLNNRPRKKFGFKTPNQVFLQQLKTTSQVAFMI